MSWPWHTLGRNLPRGLVQRHADYRAMDSEHLKVPTAEAKSQQVTKVVRLGQQLDSDTSTRKKITSYDGCWVLLLSEAC